ncbi:MAG: hypothetical protein GW833_01515 [Desulfuromonadales bacterium]|nr:hypothetical protein [Desulfuromonadales bacterium]
MLFALKGFCPSLRLCASKLFLTVNVSRPGKS